MYTLEHLNISLLKWFHNLSLADTIFPSTLLWKYNEMRAEVGRRRTRSINVKINPPQGVAYSRFDQKDHSLTPSFIKTHVMWSECRCWLIFLVLVVPHVPSSVNDSCPWHQSVNLFIGWTYMCTECCSSDLVLWCGTWIHSVNCAPQFFVTWGSECGVVWCGVGAVTFQATYNNWLDVPYLYMSGITVGRLKIRFALYCRKHYH